MKGALTTNEHGSNGNPMSRDHSDANVGSMSPWPSAQLSSMSMTRLSSLASAFGSAESRTMKSTCCAGTVLKKSLITQTLGSLTQSTDENESAKYAAYLARTYSSVFSSKPQFRRFLSSAMISESANVAVLRRICPAPEHRYS